MYTYNKILFNKFRTINYYSYYHLHVCNYFHYLYQCCKSFCLLVCKMNLLNKFYTIFLAGYLRTHCFKSSILFPWPHSSCTDLHVDTEKTQSLKICARCWPSIKWGFSEKSVLASILENYNYLLRKENALCF